MSNQIMSHEVTPFGQILDGVAGRDGDSLHVEVSLAMADLVQQMQEHGGGGTLTLKLVLKPNGDSAVMIAPQVTSNPPKPKRQASLFFPGKEGSLMRDDPRQTRMDLRSVDDDNRPIKKA